LIDTTDIVPVNAALHCDIVPQVVTESITSLYLFTWHHFNRWFCKIELQSK